jgi:hypothetical protein
MCQWEHTSCMKKKHSFFYAKPIFMCQWGTDDTLIFVKGPYIFLSKTHIYVSIWVTYSTYFSTDCTGSCKFNYHIYMITTTTAPLRKMCVICSPLILVYKYICGYCAKKNVGLIRKVCAICSPY